MTHGEVTVVSMRNINEAFDNLPKTTRDSYLHKLLNEIKPDIAILPADQMKPFTFSHGYGKYVSPNNTDTVMLYNKEKVHMSTQFIAGNVFKNLQGLDPAKISWPEVTVSGKNQVINTFSIVSFHNMFNKFDQSPFEKNEKLMYNLAQFSQRVAIATGNPVMVEGEIMLPYMTTLMALTDANVKTDQALLGNSNALLRSFDYQPSMVKPATCHRSLLVDLQTIEYEWGYGVMAGSRPQHSWEDCTILSNALRLSISRGDALNIEGILGHTITFPIIDAMEFVPWEFDFTESLTRNVCKCCIL